MGRTRERLLAVVIVIGVAVAAYAAVVSVAPITAVSNPSIPVMQPGGVIFSVRNTTGVPIDVTGFTPPNMAVPADCLAMTIRHIDFVALPITIQPGDQAQFVADSPASGFGSAKTYTCTWTIDTNPLDPSPAMVTTTFNVTPPATNLEMQPVMLDFGSQVKPDFEVQKVLIRSYEMTASKVVTLTISGDPGAADVTFAGPPCTAGTTVCSGFNVPGAGGAFVTVQCRPVETQLVTATLRVSDGLGSGLQTQIQCLASGTSIQIDDNPINITAPIGTIGSATTNISSTSGAMLASAFVTADPTFKLSYCNAASCSWTPPQTLPYGLTVECETAATQKMGTLTVVDQNGGSANATVFCTGTGSPPVLEVGTVNPFGNVQVGSSTTQMIELTNTGGSTLTNLVAEIQGINAGHWRVSGCSMLSPCELEPLASTMVTVTFEPLAHDAKPATLQLTSNAMNNPVDVSIDGTGQGGVMVVQEAGPPYVLDLGTIPRGQAFAGTITLRNDGNFPYTAMQNGGVSPYTVTPMSLPVDVTAPQDLTVTCQSPTATPTTNDYTLAITSDAYAGSAQSVLLKCKIADTIVQVTPNQFDFGEVRINTDPNPRRIEVTVTNPATSLASAVVHSIGLRVQQPGLALVPATTSTTLAPGLSTSATLELATGSDTDLTGQFLDINVDNAMLQFPVTGKVVTPSSRTVPQTLDLGTACVGTTVSGHVMLINDGTATLMVDKPVMEGSFLASSPDTPTQLPAKQSLTAEVMPAMSATGEITGTMMWHSDVPITHEIPVKLEYVSTGTALSPKGLDFGIIEVIDGTEESAPQTIRLQNCDLTPSMIKIEALRTTQGALAAWNIEPRIGYSKELRGMETQAISVTFRPPARGRYEADLEVSTPAGPQKIHLVGEATGRDFDETSFYACACHGAGGPSRGWPALLAIAWVIFRRRRGSSSAR